MTKCVSNVFDLCFSSVRMIDPLDRDRQTRVLIVIFCYRKTLLKGTIDIFFAEIKLILMKRKELVKEKNARFSM